MSPTCPKCGTMLSADALQGLCRKCLGALAFALPPQAAGAEGNDTEGSAFGDYELLEEIGRGGMGVVYKARQLSLNRLVAVKMVLHGSFSSAEFVRRFQTEAEAAAGLHHPNIVAIYEVGRHAGRHYFSMEFVEGTNLADLIREHPLPARRAAAYLETIAEAIHYAHQRGILHRDLKPSNLVIDIFDQPRILDFGLAKLIHSDSQLTLTGQTLGSPNHMPPEQAEGRRTTTGPEGDVYSLGAILYQLLTGRPPFQGETIQEILLQVRNIEPVPPRSLNLSVPIDLQTICLKCLAKEPTRRYRTAGELAADLERFLANKPIQACPASSLQKMGLWCRRRPVTAGLSSALLLAVVLGLGGVLWEWRQANRHALGEAGLRRVAEASEAKVRLNLYAADISLASQAIQRSDYGLARHTLAALLPKPGEMDLRGFEWRYLWNLSRGDQLATLTGHTYTVTCAAFSPDGNWIASGGQDGSARIWDARKFEPIATLPTGVNPFWSTGFSPDGALLLTAGFGEVKLWNPMTRQSIATYPGTIAVLSRTGSLLAATEASPFYWEKGASVTLWNYRTGEKLRTSDGPGRTLAFSPDNRILAIAGTNHSVGLWDVSSGQLLRTLPTDGPIWMLTFSPKGNQLAAVGWSPEPLVWELPGPTTPRKLKGHSLTVWSAAFSPDGSTIATAASDQTVRLWDAVTLEPKGILRGHKNEVWCVAYSADGRLLVSGGKDQTVRIWSAEPPARPVGIPSFHATRPVFSNDGSRMATYPPEALGNRPQIWDLARQTLITNAPDYVVAGFSTDGTEFALVDYHRNTLLWWSPANPVIRPVTLPGIDSRKNRFARAGFSPGYKVFFAIDETGTARFWEPSSGKLLASLATPQPPLRAAVLGPGAKYLAVSLEPENFVRLYEVATGHETQLTGHHDFVSGVAFSPDETTLATGSMDGTIRLWEVATGRELALLAGHMEEVTDVAFSPDGRTIASLGHKDSIKLWHVATRRELVSLSAPDAGVFLQFVPDGRHLAYTTEDDRVRFLDAPPANRDAPKPTP